MTEWRALTVKQPWAWAICHAGKNVENRTWPIPPKYLTGGSLRLMIHAGDGWDDSMDTGRNRGTHWAMFSNGTKVVARRGARQKRGASGEYVQQARPSPDTRQPFGAIVAVATVSSHPYFDEEPEWGRPCCRSPWAERTKGMHHWELSDVQVLATPVPASGRQKLWTPTAEVVAAVEAQCHSASGGDS